MRSEAVLINIAERSLDHHDHPVGRRERFRINVFIDPTSDLPATWQDGYPLPDTLRQWLWCDGSLTPTFVEQGRPVAVGPTIKGIPDRIRRLVLARDRKCRVPWCESTIGLQVHHIIHRENGGPIELWNLMAACPRDHRLHHLGGFDVTGDANDPAGLTFTDPRGQLIDPAARPRPPTRPPPDPIKPYEHPPGERLDRWSLTFPPPPPAPSPAA